MFVMKNGGPAIVAALVMTACIPVQPDIRSASAQGGDFTLLNCNQLATAEGSLRQRLAALDGSQFLAFGVVAPTGEPAAEQRMIVQSATDEMASLRARRNCTETAPIVTAEQVLAEPEPAPAPAQEPVAASTTTAAAPAAAANTQTLQPGRYLQVATFATIQNRDAALAAFRQRGINANSQPVMLAGRQHHRILVGPLRSRSDIRKADSVSRSLGLRDSFFVNG